MKARRSPSGKQRTLVRQRAVVRRLIEQAGFASEAAGARALAEVVRFSAPRETPPKPGGEVIAFPADWPAR